MKLLLVEDELTTARALQRLLHAVRPEAEVLAHLQTVADTVTWLRENPAPDLLLMDIHLGDGSSFEVFQQVPMTCPVIFITAYDEHALEAFRANGIDYLLKPVDEADLSRSLTKFDALRQHYIAGVATSSSVSAGLDIATLLHTVQQLGATPAYKTSWLIPYKAKLVPVAAAEVAHFVIRHGLVCLTTLAGQEYSLDVSLDELESQVNPKLFFRANRQVLFARNSVVELELHHNGRMAVYLNPAAREEVIVPKPRVTELRRWMS